MLKNYVVPYLKGGQEYVIVSHNVHIFGRGRPLWPRCWTI